jgi:slime mold repeat-containing protein/NHL repeat-containing protein
MRRVSADVFWIAVLLLATPVAAVRYRIDVFAGSGAAGTPDAVGDGLPATAGLLDAPTGLARDRHGDVYVADHDHARVRRVQTRRGVRVITTVAGTGVRGFAGDGGPATTAELTRPTGVSLTRDRQLLITDAGDDNGGDTVRRVDRRGVIHPLAGVGDAPPGDAGDGGPAIRASLATPLRTAVARDGDVYIVELNNNRVRVVHAADGSIRPYAGTGEAGDAGDGGRALDALLAQPAGLALARDGTLYVADFGNERIRVVTPDGIIHALAGTGVRTGSLDGEGGDPSDDLGDGRAAATATFYKPTGVALARDGSLLVADQGNSRIRRIAPAVSGAPGPDSIVTTIVGNGAAGYAGEGGDALAASLLIPTDVLPLSRGRLLIADRGNGRVRIAVPVAATNLCSASCGDGDPCTIDRCDPERGCLHVVRPACRRR